MLQNPHVLLTFDKVHNPVRLPRKTASERPKMLRTPQFSPLLTSKCALFRHLNFQKWSGPGVFCAFWLRNVLRTTTVCTFLVLRTRQFFSLFTSTRASRHNCVHFSTSQLPKVVRTCCVFNILTSSRHNGVQFSSLICPAGSAPAALASLLFDPPEPQIIGIKHRFRDFPFSRTWIFFLLRLSLFWSSFFFLISSFFFFLLLSSSLLFSSLLCSALLCSSLLFSSLLFSDSYHLCFSPVHVVIVGSLTSKLPSILVCIYTYACLLYIRIHTDTFKHHIMIIFWSSQHYVIRDLWHRSGVGPRQGP